MSHTEHSAHTAPATAPQANGEDTSKAVVTLTIAEQEVTLPVKFVAGMTITENQAKVLDAAYQRQFTNNQNALFAALSKKLEAAKTDAEKAAVTFPTASVLAERYQDYEPNVGGTPRQSVMEKLRSDAAWRFWSAHVKAHNDAVAAGNEPVIVKAGKKAVQLPSGKGAAEKREAMSAALLAAPQYADRIQEHLDAIMAERGSKRTETATAEVAASGADLI
jgi:hypothetical protein